MEEVGIEWYGPYQTDTVVEEFHEYEDFGVYMITADGENTLRRYFTLVSHIDKTSVQGFLNINGGYPTLEELSKSELVISKRKKVLKRDLKM